MKIRTKSLGAIATFVAVFVSAAIVLSFSSKGDEDEISPVTLLTFAPGLLLSAVLLVREAKRRAYSLHAMHLLFVVTFFYLASLAQYLAREMLGDWVPFRMDDGQVVLTNVITLAWVVSYAWAYRSGRALKPVAVSGGRSRNVHPTGLRVSFILSLACFAYLQSLGLLGVTTRGRYEELAGIDTGSGFLVVSIFVRGIPIMALGAWCLSLTRATGLERWRHWMPIAVLSLGNLLVNNPLAAPRFWTATVGIGLLSILALRRSKGGGWIAPAVIAGLFIAMPLLSFGRSADSGSAYLNGFTMAHAEQSFLSGDFDAFMNISLTNEYVHDKSISFGRQLLGVPFFFVPRSLWPDKPVGSGYVVAEHFRMYNNNIASPLPAEAIINFGYLGIPLFAFVFGRTLRRVDELYWSRQGARGCRPSWLEVIYPFWLGLTFFLSRGDLLSSVAYSAGLTCASLPLLVRLPRSFSARAASVSGHA